MIVTQFGESANTLVQRWRGGYRNGFPTFRAAELPVRPMHYDQSQIYTGVIGRQYEDSTNRYNYLYDPNMYLQPGFSDFGSAAEQAAIAALEGFLAFAPTGFDNFDVVFDTGGAGGVGISTDNRLMIVHGATLRAIQGATATAGGLFATQTPNADLARRITAQRDLGDPQLATATLGKVDTVRAAVNNLITVLKSGTATPFVPVAQPAVGSFTLSRKTQIAIGGVVGVLAIAGITALVLRRRTHTPSYPAYDY